nr:MAG TPA: hypothetical protein [Bacteriophage sp.]
MKTIRCSCVGNICKKQSDSHIGLFLFDFHEISLFNLYNIFISLMRG